MAEQPAYQRVADAIRADIDTRRLVEGDQLPPVRDLAQQHGVPVGTVAKAIAVLRGEGIVAAHHGRGLYVQQFPRIVRSSPGRLSRARWASGQSIQDADTNGRLRVVNVIVGEAPADGEIAEAFGIFTGVPVLRRARTFAVDDRIIQLATSWLPLDVAARAPAVTYTDPGPGGIYARMDDAGLGPVEFVERLVCRMPTAAESSGLGLAGMTPVVAVTRRAYTGDGRCVEVNAMVLDASAYTLEYRFSA